MTDSDIRHMNHALTIGARGLGRVWPNPAVGCVIVHDDLVIGRGVTADGGRPHAETIALAQAGAAAKGATAFVTLEPCSHQGEAPPCTDALIAAGISRVVIAITDPDPRVDGSGIDRLTAAGISVNTGLCAGAAAITHAGFLSRVQRGRPMVTLKLAASMDGRIATASGESKWITGASARRVVHGLRASHDAVLVGAGTVRADDPTLNVRDLGIRSQPVRVVLASDLDLPLDSNLARTARDIPVWLIHGPDAGADRVRDWQALGARLFQVDAGGNGLDVGQALAALGSAGLTRIFCEGGGALAASLLAAAVVDEIVAFSAGIALGADGVPMIGDLGVGPLGDAPAYELVETLRVGGDVMTTWRAKEL